MDQLEEFYREIKCGITVGDFIKRRAQLTLFIDSAGLMSDYRLARGRLKKLRAEIAPMTRFIKAQAETDDIIQFPLDDNGPVDCNLWHGSRRHQKIQITAAQGHERFYCMDELNKTGAGRGFLGLTDDMSRDKFKDAMDRERNTYSTPEAQQTITKAVHLCIEKKADKFGADTLVIEVPNYRLLQLPHRIKHDFSYNVAKSPFSEIFLVVVNDNGDQCIQIK